MGCASSKRVEAAVVTDVYRPPPTSIALFDISKIDEPWLITTTTTAVREDEEIKKPTNVPLPILEKLDSYELAPHSWSEVSKALEDLKPTLHKLPTSPVDAMKPNAPKKTPPFHTLQDLDSAKEKSPPRPSPPELAGFRPVKENSFVIRDREERKNKKGVGEQGRWRRRDPLEAYPEHRPPGNAEGVVLYTTSLRGVRRTFENCETARGVVEAHAVDAGVEVEERDVSLHGEFLKEVRDLAGEGAALPRLFVKGRYVGGVEEVVELGETGKLREMMRWVAARGGGRGEVGKGGIRGCEGCGGARFVPCWDCNGSCKVVGVDGKELVRCGECNENGLILCPLCH